MRIILLGPPGAGKGTVAALLKDTLNIPHISTGDIFREEMANETELGRKIKQFVESGALVPDEVVTQIIEKRVTSDSGRDRYMLDGFPRTKKQAEDFDQILSKIECPVDYVFYMEASLSLIIQRLTGRRVCKNCRTLYHVENKPPKKEGICDRCGGELYRRADDNEETIKKRMDVYLESTAPIVDYYEARGKLKKVNADLDGEEVQAELMRIFHEDGKLDQNKIAERN